MHYTNRMRYMLWTHGNRGGCTRHPRYPTSHYRSDWDKKMVSILHGSAYAVDWQTISSLLASCIDYHPTLCFSASISRGYRPGCDMLRVRAVITTVAKMQWSLHRVSRCQQHDSLYCKIIMFQMCKRRELLQNRLAFGTLSLWSTEVLAKIQYSPAHLSKTG